MNNKSSKYQYFPSVNKAISFEGPKSEKPLAFKFYDPSLKIEGKSMQEHLKPCMAWWHTLCGEGEDPFGGPAQQLSWPAKAVTTEEAKQRADAGFELMEILGIPYFAFHDSDIAPNGKDWNETYANLIELGEYLEQAMQKGGQRCGWATQNCFSEQCFSNGAGTAQDPEVWVYAANRTKAALDLGKMLSADNHVFWDGRGGFSNLLTKDLEADLRRKGILLQKAVEYRDSIGHKAQFLVEPKPKEPTAVQYDSDAAGILSFLEHCDRSYSTKLYPEFKLNLEDNHATLAGKPFWFEIDYAGIRGKLGSLDANQGLVLNGWDTDHMPFDPRNAAMTMYYVLKHGGLGKGVLNFDAKVRRGSSEPIDRIHGFILALDTYALGLRIAVELRTSSAFSQLQENLYTSWQSELGEAIDSGSFGFEDCAKRAKRSGAVPKAASEHEELFESLVNNAYARAVAKI